MNFLDKLIQKAKNFEKKLDDAEARLSKKADKPTPAENKKGKLDKLQNFVEGQIDKLQNSVQGQIDKLDESIAHDEADIKALSADKNDLTKFLHLLNAANYSTTEKQYIALKAFCFNNSPEAQDFNISKHISIGMRTGSRRAVSRDVNPLIELFIDDINQRFTIFDLRNRNELHFYHFSEILEFKYDETTNVSGASIISTEVTRMVINVKLSRLESNLSIPFMNDNFAFFNYIATNDDFYLRQREIANEVLAAFAYMKNAASHEKDSIPNKPAPSQANIADELRKFKQLQEEGLISAEDFEAKKQQLLGL